MSTHADHCLAKFYKSSPLPFYKLRNFTVSLKYKIQLGKHTANMGDSHAKSQKCNIYHKEYKYFKRNK